MTEPDQPKSKLFPMRLTADERGRWEAAAAGKPLAGFVRACVESVIKGRIARPLQGLTERDHQTLAKIFAWLGQSRISSNLNQIAKGVNTGSIVVTPETETLLQQACQALLEIRDMLMRLLPKAGRR